MNVTESGRPCLMWANLSFRLFNYSLIKGPNSNFCRIYLNSSRPGCFTANNNISWEFCSIPRCGFWADYPCGNKLKSFICKRRNGTIVKRTAPAPAPLMIQGGCPTGFTPSLINNKCYFVSNNTDKVTWNGARSRCMSYGKGFDLVSIRNADEMSFVTSLLKNYYYARWIGIKKSTAGTFQWIDNTELTYTNWQLGQPSGGSANCGVLWTVLRSGQWMLRNCYAYKGYICQGKKDPNLPSPVSAMCPKGYSEYTDRCFKFTTLALNRKSAEVHCNIDGGHLASITSFFEHEFLRILAKTNSVDGFWIGLQATNNTTSFFWKDGSPYVFSKWSPSEPSMKPSENCVMQSNGSWHDVSCDMKLPSLCEINKDSIGHRNQPIDCKESEYGFTTSLPFESTCFYAVRDIRLNWLDAKRTCQSRGTQLASILSDVENEHVHEYLGRQSHDSYWIGLTRKSSTNRPRGFGWYWIGGVNLEYKHWSHNEPSSSLFYNRNQCGEMLFTGFWNDASCSKLNRFICKRVVQQPTTMQQLTTFDEEETERIGPLAYTTESSKGPNPEKKPQPVQDYIVSQEECLQSQRGENYTGKMNVTESGRPCYMWANLSFRFFNYSLVKGPVFNFCRNYRNSSRPGCFTANNSTSWEFCSIPRCDFCETQPCENNGTCETIGYSFRCTCPTGYFGDLCESDEATVFCGEDWIMLENGCYKYNSERLTKHNAQNKCRFYDSELPGRWYRKRKSLFTDLYNLTSMYTADLWTLLHARHKNDLIKSGINISVNGIHQNVSNGVDFCIVTNSSDMTSTLYAADCNDMKSFVCYKPKGRCPSGWYHHGNQCYLYKPFLLASYDDAQLYCNTQNGSIIEPKSMKDQEFITQYVKRMAEVDEKRIWIGLKNSPTGQWVWNSNDTLLMYGNWYDSRSGNGLDCAYSDTDWSGKWKSDLPCNTPLGVVCVSEITQYQKPEGIVAHFGGKRHLVSPMDPNTMYIIPDNLVTWNEAYTICKERGELLSLSSQAEENLILGWLNANDRKSLTFWTGGNQRDDTKGWQWTDDKPFKYINWHKGEPKPSGKCLAMSFGYYSSWMAESCSQFHQPICKITFMKRRKPMNNTQPVTTVPTVTNASYGCSSGWQRLNRHCFKFFFQNVTQPEAKKACLNEGSQLASIPEGSEFFLYHIYRQAAQGPSLRSWIGLEFNSNHLSFEWSDGSKVYQTYWSKNEPGQSNEKNSEICVSSDEHLLWYTTSCNTMMKGFLCRKDPENLVATTVSQFEIGCNKGSLGYGAYCYSKGNNTLSWPDAQASCKAQGGNLATIGSREVQGFLTYTLSSDSKDYWIGYKHEANKTAVWSSGASVTFTYIGAKGSSGRGQYIGCFWDNFTRIMEPHKIGIRSLQQCLNRCTGRQKLYAGVEYQTECFCGNEIKNFPRKADSHCRTMRCTGNYQEYCGGTWSIAIYHTGIKRDRPCVVMSMQPPPGLWHYRECTETNNYICEFPRIGFTTTTTPIPTTPPPRCPDSWMSYKEYCYKIFTEKRSWTDASKACTELGTDLVSIHSRGEFDFVANKVRDIRMDTWIGLSDRATENVFTWSDGSPFDFEDWRNNQPDNWYNNEDCCTMTTGYTRAFNDQPCVTASAFMCKVKKGVKVNETYSQVTTEKCKDGFYFFRGFCYYIYNQTTPINYFEAKRACHDKKAELTSIHDLEETNYLITLMWKFSKENKIWTGLTELNDDFTYRWDDGTVVDFQNWGKTEPNDVGGEERCMVMSKTIGFWADYPCGYKLKSFICKRRNGTLVKPTTPAPVMIQGGCPTGFTPSPINNKCYFVSNNTDKATWNGARSKCMSFGKSFDLVSIRDADEMSFVTSLLKKYYYGRWIGLKNDAARTFQWIDNTELTYTNWQSGQPSGGSAKCGVLWTVLFSGQWASSGCNSKYGYICQGKKDPNLQSPVSATCPKGYSEYTDRCFKFTTLALNRKSAEVHCNIDNGHLASITSFFEHEFLRILAKTSSVGGFWIGLQATNSTTSFVWKDGSPYLFTKWSPSEPSMKPSENCVMQSNGSWHDVSCDMTLPSLCEINKDPIGHRNQPVDCKESEYGFTTSLPFESTCFYAVRDTRLNWLDANRACQSRGTQLASILSDVENEHVHEYIKKLGRQSHDSYWMGLTRKSSTDRPSGFGWYWIVGVNLDYKHWSHNEPSSSLFDNRDQCGEMLFTGFWNDASCSKLNRFICKRVVQQSTTMQQLTTFDEEETESIGPLAYTTESFNGPNPERQSQPVKDKSFPLGGIVGIIILILLVCVFGLISAYFIAKKIKDKRSRIPSVSGFENAIYKPSSTQKLSDFS